MLYQYQFPGFENNTLGIKDVIIWESWHTQTILFLQQFVGSQIINELKRFEKL